MKTLKIYNGGHNHVGDDLLFLQSGDQAAITSYCKTLGIPLLVITGCVVNTAGPTITWTAGWIYINGELCEVDAGVAALGTDDTWIIQETYDPIGNQQYENLTTYDTFVIRKAVISGNAGGTNLYSNAKRLRDFLLLDIAGSTGLGPMSLTWTLPVGSSGVRRYINQINDLVVTGPVGTSSYNSGTQSVICVLDHPPGRPYTFCCAAIINGTNTFVNVNVDTSGNVTPIGLTNGQAVTIYLDAIRYSLHVQNN